jgi:hypothetical protein
VNGNLVQLCPAEDLLNNTIYTMWEVEFSDVTKGGSINFNSSYRFRNVATQHLLSVEINQDEDDSSFDEIVTVSSSDNISSPRENIEGGINGLNKSLKKIPSLSNIPTISESRKLPGLNIPKINSFFGKELSTKDSFSSPAVDSPSLDPDRYLGGKSDGGILSTEDDDAIEVTGSVIAVPHNENNETLWKFVSPNGISTDYILYDSFVRFFHVDSETWLHGISEKFDSKKSFVRQRAHISLETRSIFHQEDVFKVSKVNERDVDNFITFKSLMLPLTDYYEKVMDDEKMKLLQNEDIAIVSQILSKLIIFITKSSEMNALERDGVPYPDRQQVVRQTKILDTVINILTQLIKRGVIKTEWFVREKYSEYWKTYRLAYRLIYLSVKNNPEIGDYMYSYIDVMQEHIDTIPIINSGTKGIDIGASNALMNVLKNNLKLLNQLSTNQIDFFIKMMIKSDKNDETFSYPFI